MFEGRLPAKLQEHAPKIVVNDAGHEVWEFEGQTHYQVGMNALAGRRPEHLRGRAVPLRPDASGLLRPARARRRHGPGRDLGVAQLPVDDHRLLRPGVLVGLRPRRRPRRHAGVQRLDVRGVVAAGTRPVHPARHHLPRRRGEGRRGDPAQRRAWLRRREPVRAPAPHRLPVDLRRVLGPGDARVRGDRHRDLSPRRLGGHGRRPARTAVGSGSAPACSASCRSPRARSGCGRGG